MINCAILIHRIKIFFFDLCKSSISMIKLKNLRLRTSTWASLQSTMPPTHSIIRSSENHRSIDLLAKQRELTLICSMGKVLFCNDQLKTLRQLNRNSGSISLLFPHSSAFAYFSRSCFSMPKRFRRACGDFICIPGTDAIVPCPADR